MRKISYSRPETSSTSWAPKLSLLMPSPHPQSGASRRSHPVGCRRNLAPETAAPGGVSGTTSGYDPLALVGLPLCYPIGNLSCRTAGDRPHRDAGADEREVSQGPLTSRRHRDLDLVPFDRPRDGGGHPVPGRGAQGPRGACTPVPRDPNPPE